MNIIIWQARWQSYCWPYSRTAFILRRLQHSRTLQSITSQPVNLHILTGNNKWPKLISIASLAVATRLMHCKRESCTLYICPCTGQGPMHRPYSVHKNSCHHQIDSETTYTFPFRKEVHEFTSKFVHITQQDWTIKYVTLQVAVFSSILTFVINRQEQYKSHCSWLAIFS